MARLTVALICRNEQENLPGWLEAVGRFADEVVAVDSGSSDETAAMLQAAGAKVVHRGWTGYSDQRNHAASLATGEIVLFLDADEYPDLEMSEALNRFKANPPNGQTAWEIPYKIFFFGRFLRHGGFFPERHLRMYLNGRARWEGRQVHERLVSDGPVGRFEGGYVEHHSYRTLGQYLRRMDRYSSQAARQMFIEGRRTGPLAAWGHGLWAFFSRYLLRAGFLDGWAGYLAARMEGLYTFTKYARLLEICAREGKS